MSGTTIAFYMLMVACVVMFISLLWYVCLVRRELEKTTEELNQAKRHLRVIVESTENIPLHTGICCCGSPMEGHENPLFCGHDARDIWDYYGEHLLIDARAWLEGHK